MAQALLRSMDLGIRGGAFVVLMLLAGLYLRDAGRTRAVGLRVTAALGAAAFAVASGPGAHTAMGPWGVPLRVLATGETVVLWLCALQLFDDGFRLRAWHGAVWSIVLLLGFANAALPRDNVLLPWVNKLLGCQAEGFALLAAVQILWGWRGDLVERRRSARAAIIAAAAGYCLLLPFMDMASAYSETAHVLAGLASAVGLLVVALSAAWSGLRLAPGVTGPPAASAKDAAPAGEMTLGPADRAVLAQLDRLMDHERIYRQENLNIGALAARLGVPEYRLRRLINQGLGHRNFAAFVNAWRLGEARAALADPGQAQVPVLTIALDSGFASIGPFNRAFKADTGLTPTEFRQRALAESGTPNLSASRISNPA
jgi:AraC-like DNA-binding protein